MSIINLRPVGWGGMTPKQWDTLRDMLLQIIKTAHFLGNEALFLRATFLLSRVDNRHV